jgi:4,5-DOPA dioxygenase extradiol
MSRLPALFIGHGSPMNAIEANAYARAWAQLGRELPAPRAILCISAHWETDGVAVTAAATPETIHDFYGFPRTLFEVRYPAPGDPALAQRIADLLAPVAAVTLDPRRGLDHGAWSVLRPMYPDAQIPVLQLSLDRRRPARAHYALGQALAPLREDGVLLLGSGNIVHNLAILDWQREGGYDWAVRIGQRMQQHIEAGEHGPLIDYGALDPEIRLAVPTPEHYLPLLYILGAAQADDSVRLLSDQLTLGSIAMTSVVLGG